MDEDSTLKDAGVCRISGTAADGSSTMKVSGVAPWGMRNFRSNR